MRLLLVTFLFLKIFSPAYANTIYYLTKIPNLEIYDLTASNGIKYLKAEKPFKVGIVKSNVQCNKPSGNNPAIIAVNIAERDNKPHSKGMPDQ